MQIKKYFCCTCICQCLSQSPFLPNELHWLWSWFISQCMNMRWYLMVYFIYLNYVCAKNIYMAINLFFYPEWLYGTGNGKININMAINCMAVTIIQYGAQPYKSLEVTKNTLKVVKLCRYVLIPSLNVYMLQYVYIKSISRPNKLVTMQWLT